MSARTDAICLARDLSHGRRLARELARDRTDALASDLAGARDRARADALTDANSGSMPRARCSFPASLRRLRGWYAMQVTVKPAAVMRSGTGAPSGDHSGMLACGSV